MSELETLLARFRQKDRLALARLLTWITQGRELPALSAALATLPANAARVVALTGSTGVGKSSLLGRLIEHLRGQGIPLAVLACDPQSPRSGGALLGDRFRMGERPGDDGLFIRSLAAPAGSGGLAPQVALMLRLLAAFGFPLLFLETAGAGQNDLAVRPLADVLVLLLQPHTGDELQWEKAGLLELADIVVVHKADLPHADQTVAQVRAMLSLSAAPPPVLAVSAHTGQGVAELWQAIQAVPPRRSLEAAALLALAQQVLATRFAHLQRQNPESLSQLADLWQRGTLSAEEAATRLLQLLTTGAEASP
jgi:LAO/AO transport system kinase